MQRKLPSVAQFEMKKKKKQQTKTEFDEVKHLLTSPYVMGLAA